MLILNHPIYYYPGLRGLLEARKQPSSFKLSGKNSNIPFQLYDPWTIGQWRDIGQEQDILSCNSFAAWLKMGLGRCREVSST